MSFHIFIGEGKRKLELSVDEFLKQVRRRLHPGGIDTSASAATSRPLPKRGNITMAAKERN